MVTNHYLWIPITLGDKIVAIINFYLVPILEVEILKFRINTIVPKIVYNN